MELGPTVLEGTHVRLEPLTLNHAEELGRAGSDPELWRWFPAALDTEKAMVTWIEQALAAARAGSEIPFAVINRATGGAVGSTRYLDISQEHRGVEVGWTWYSRAGWGGPVNPESKYLLLRHAFEDWGAIRLCLKTDSLNTRSRGAISKLGAVHEGDLRNHRLRPDGTFRHSSYYSILDAEWPAVRQRLLDRLAAYRS